MPIDSLDFTTSPPTEGTLATAADSDVPGGSVVLYPVGAVDPVEMTIAQLQGSDPHNIEVLHDSNIIDPIPILFVTPGSKTATTVADIPAVIALTAGVFTVDGISTAPIDFSGVVDAGEALTMIVDLANAAIANVAALDGYEVGLGYTSPNDYFLVRHFGGNVGVLSGNVVTAMGLDTFDEGMFSPKSDSIFIAPPASGHWRELRFFGTATWLNSSIIGTFRSTLISDNIDTFSWLSALGNTGAWWEEQNSNEPNGLYNIGKVTAYGLLFSDLFYNSITGEITWDLKVAGFIPNPTGTYKINSLFVIGIRG